MNLAASLIGHADHRLLGGGGAFGGEAGRWAKGLDGLDCPVLGRRGWGDIPLSSYISTSYFFGAFGGAGGGALGRILVGAGGLTFMPSLATRCSSTCCLGRLSLLTFNYLL